MLDMKGNRVMYFGHSTFSLTTASGQVGLIDPWVMTNPVCPDKLKKVPKLDVIFLSHAHSDHLGDCWRSRNNTSRRLWPSSRPVCGLRARDSRKRRSQWGKGERRRSASLK